MTIAHSCAGWFVAAPLARCAVPRAAQQRQASVIYRCPGNDYTNTLAPQEAKSAAASTIEGAPITVIQTHASRGRRRRRACRRPARRRRRQPRVDPATQRARDSDARRILEAELREEEERLAELQKEYNNGEPERQGERAQLPEVPRPRGRNEAPASRASESDIAAHPARDSASCRS